MEDDSIYKRFSICTIFNIINKMGTAELAKRYGKFDLDNGTHQYLFALYIKDGISQDELTHLIAVDKVSTARAVERLKNAGYVRVEIDDNDRRKHIVFLTDYAMSRQKEILKIAEEWQEEVLKPLTSEERAELTRILGKVIYSLVGVR